MQKALVTFATGAYQMLLDLSGPHFDAYAQRHGYRFIVADNVPETLPGSWYKIKVLHQLLATYDAVLWLDCDIAIADGTQDIADAIKLGAWQALVEHTTWEGTVPNCGVWYVTPPMQPVLAEVWSMTQYWHHRWWEQAAMLELLGYTPNALPVVRAAVTPLYEHTQFLGLEWNSHESACRAERPRFAHCTYGPLDWRAERMRAYLAQAVSYEPA